MKEQRQKAIQQNQNKQVPASKQRSAGRAGASQKQASAVTKAYRQGQLAAAKSFRAQKVSSQICVRNANSFDHRNSTHHEKYRQAWIALGAPPMMHPPKPVFSGMSGLHQYAIARSVTGCSSVTIAVGNAALVLFDDAESCVRTYVASVATILDTARAFTYAECIADRNDYTLAASASTGPGYTARPALNMVMALASDDSHSVGGNGTIASVIGEHYPQVQRLYGDVSVALAVPYNGSATSYTLASNMNPFVIGDQMTTNVNNGPDSNFPRIVAVPSIVTNGAASYRELAQTYGVVEPLVGATPGALCNTKFVLYNSGSWFSYGGVVTPAPGGNANVTAGFLAANPIRMACSGFQIIENTGATNITIVTRGSAVYASTLGSGHASSLNPLASNLRNSADFLETNIRGSMPPTPSYERLPGGTLPPPTAINQAHAADHASLAKSAEAGFAGASAAAYLEKHPPGSIVRKAASLMRKGLSAAGSFLERQAGNLLSQAAKAAPEVGEGALMLV